MEGKMVIKDYEGAQFNRWVRQSYYLYEVKVENRLAGHVEVLSRATAAPQVYGGQLRVARSEYEGRIEPTDHRFIVHDIHAAVREVARRAREAWSSST
jgi:hypothetical protein